MQAVGVMSHMAYDKEKLIKPPLLETFEISDGDELTNVYQIDECQVMTEDLVEMGWSPTFCTNL